MQNKIIVEIKTRVNAINKGLKSSKDISINENALPNNTTSITKNNHLL